MGSNPYSSSLPTALSMSTASGGGSNGPACPFFGGLPTTNPCGNAGAPPRAALARAAAALARAAAPSTRAFAAAR
jgi:hypothetical protein